MFIDKIGRYWTSEIVYKNFTKQRGKIPKMQLAFENYADDTQDNSQLVTDTFNEIKIYCENLNKFNESQIEQQGKKVLDTLSTTMEKIGKN